MAYTNFQEWAVFYADLLSKKYYDFCNLFPRGEEPNYSEFIHFVWVNTSKVKNHYTGKIEAKINKGL